MKISNSRHNIGAYAALLLMVAFAFSSCQNNGHIGSLFGTWSLYEMKIDGEPAADFDSESTLWSFQNNIIFISRVGDHHTYTNYFGTWEKADDGKVLLLDYTHSADGISPGTSSYTAPAWLGFTPNEIMRLTFIKDSSREMVLTWTNPEGKIYTYYLRKTW